MEKYVFDKLVRDKQVEIFNNRKIVSTFKVLSAQEKEHYLKLKLIEEAEEIFLAKDREELIEEIADIQEVLESLKNSMAICDKEIEEKALSKQNLKGSFDIGIYIKHIEMDEDNILNQYFKKHPQKYPHQ
jgi:predicted house-cleaning noncanonical NTP pyrophosphatase (MazG superfamily)